MFFQRDYILRMIEMMGDLMRRVRELMDNLQRMRLLSDACLRHTGIPLDTAEQLTAESLETMLQPMPRLLMSEILFTKAETFSLPIEEQEELLHKSFHLLASLWEEGELCELRVDRLLEMKERIRPRLTVNELLCCARFCQECDRFSDMEDALFQATELLQKEEERAQTAGLGAAMLEAAANATLEAIAFAHTTREELLQSAQELRKLGLFPPSAPPS